jgi:hypothetical protein
VVFGDAAIRWGGTEINEVESALERARRCVEQAKGGADVTAALAESLGALAELPSSQERWEVERLVRLALFASPDPERVGAIVRMALPYWVTPVGNDGRDRGLLLREGDPLARPLAGNPWGISPTATLDEAVTRIWAGVADHAAAFIEELRRRLVGLALFDDSSGQPFLAYLLYQERDRYDVDEEFVDAPYPPFDRRCALDWALFGDVTAFVGYPPAPRPTPRLDVSLPAPLRAFYSVHAGMKDVMWQLYRPEEVGPWSIMLGHDSPRPVAVEDAGETRLSSELLDFFSYGNDASDLFDLAADPTDPPVRGWGDGMLYAGPGEPFWTWFVDHTDLFLGRAADD